MKTVRILLIGDINEDMYSVFLAELDGVPVGYGVQIVLSSSGGAAMDALAIASLIRKYPRPVAVHGTGLIASAATIILAAGHKGLRSMDSTAWLMVHEDSGKFKGTVSVLEDEAKRLRRMENQWCWLFAQYTGRSKEEWRRINKREQYLNAREALHLGVIDFIVDDIVKGK